MTRPPTQNAEHEQGNEGQDASQLPRVDRDTRRIVVSFGGEIIADSQRTIRVEEHGHPPVFYIPPEDVRVELLRSNSEQTWCEIKGDAHYYDLVVGDRVSESAAWCYPEPLAGFADIQYAIAFYPGRVDECTIDGERVTPEPGDYYGGWITS